MKNITIMLGFIIGIIFLFGYPIIAIIAINCLFNMHIKINFYNYIAMLLLIFIFKNNVSK